MAAPWLLWTFFCVHELAGKMKNHHFAFFGPLWYKLLWVGFRRKERSGILSVRCLLRTKTHEKQIKKSRVEYREKLDCNTYLTKLQTTSEELWRMYCLSGWSCIRQKWLELHTPISLSHRPNMDYPRQMLYVTIFPKWAKIHFLKGNVSGTSSCPLQM